MRDGAGADRVGAPRCDEPLSGVHFLAHLRYRGERLRRLRNHPLGLKKSSAGEMEEDGGMDAEEVMGGKSCLIE